ncbi:MAG TPA: hypothetical protein VN213_13770 [Solirubrobacteraceae bacterium]|nr:hypothetical protein [Solirubrobacteraceae bacterium]
MADKTTVSGEAEAAVERIRALNEQILEFGRQAGASFLEAYEANLKSFAEYQDTLADSSQVDWLAAIARAQANFTRELSAAWGASARDLLK